MRKNFCLYPFNAFSIDNSGRQRICCNNNGWDRVVKNTIIADPKFDVLESFNNPFHKELRKLMIDDGRHETCKKCWEVEDQGYKSWRQMYNESFNLGDKDEDYWISKCAPDGTMNHIEYMYLDITFGNKCNLKCVMCNGYNSTLYAKEQFDSGEVSENHYNKMLKLDWYADGDAIKKIFNNLSDVQRIHILGGEPLLVDHQLFLKKFVELGTSKNIHLSYNTNFTTLPSEILDIWKDFKRVFLCISVDAYKEKNEFIRFPMKWKKLEKNLDILAGTLKKYNNVYAQIHTTFGTYNMFDICELLDWIKEVSEKYDFIEPHPMANYVFYPHCFDPKHVPLSVKKKAYNQFKKWVKANKKFINTKTDKYHSGPARIGMINGYFKQILEEPCDEKLYNDMIERIKRFENLRNIKYTGFDNLIEKKSKRTNNNDE